MGHKNIIHTFKQGPWGYCGICDEKVKIEDETWQRGVLRCPTCVDRRLVGQRETEIQQVLNDGKVELAPAPKLAHPVEQVDELDISI
jgi:DNA-directed RNA polymerase subunit RPC12/RpoP